MSKPNQTKDKRKKIEITRTVRTNSPVILFLVMILIFGFIFVGMDIIIYFDEEATLKNHIPVWIVEFVIVFLLLIPLTRSIYEERTKEVVETVYIKGDLR